jgi:hypothetical protein
VVALDLGKLFMVSLDPDELSLHPVRVDIPIPPANNKALETFINGVVGLHTGRTTPDNITHWGASQGGGTFKTQNFQANCNNITIKTGNNKENCLKKKILIITILQLAEY